MFNAGKIPYIEFFDHKGPALIFIQAIGLKLTNNDRLSIFILQVINLLITQVLIYKIAKIYLSNFISIAIVLLTLLAFSFTIQGGNSTEEWSLPYLYLCLLLTIRFENYSAREQKICFVIMGMSAAILFWMRLNNMGIICACLLFIMIIALQNKNLKLFLNLTLGGLLGFFFISIPIIIYFTHIGALSEMIYASFLFNFSYIQYNLEQPFSLVDLIKGWLSLLTFIIGSILYYKKYRDYKMLVLYICLFLFAFVTTHIGPQYFHYMTLNLPLFSMGVIQIFCTQKVRLLNRNSNLVILSVAFFMLFGYTFHKKNQKQYIKDQDDTLFIHNSTDIVDKIPVNERPFVFAYNVSARFWLITNILPGYKFFTNQEWHGAHDNKIWVETNRMIQENSPLWIIIPNQDDFDKSLNPEFYNILFEEYQESYRNDDLILMRRIASN
uniref:glycosyltransferase family 39 protein n=1 Tax=uncultured Dysgonomonas sp. TaxID=206096 RepID=UPI0026124C70|nr:glycosyltransferase family 39 protein [uncultured Dysgonomonas sp.]